MSSDRSELTIVYANYNEFLTSFIDTNRLDNVQTLLATDFAKTLPNFFAFTLILENHHSVLFFNEIN